MQDKYRERVAKYSKKTNSMLKIVALLSLLITIILIAVVFFYYQNIRSALNKSYSSTGLGSARSISKLIENKKPIALLVLGTDVGSEGGFGDDRNRVGLTDSIMMVVINPKQEKTTLISVPRDIMTSISGFESSFPQKLNAAYAFKEATDNKASLGEGVGTTIKTMQKMFNIPINYYAMVNMSGLGDVVNQLGGVKVKSPLTFAFSQETAHDTGKDLYKFVAQSTNFQYASDGEHFSKYTKMNGKAALAFSRMRYQDPDGDYGRTNRQRILLNAIIKKLKSEPTKIFNFKFIHTATKNIASNLTARDILALGKDYNKAANNIQSYSVQGEGQMYNGVSYQRVTTAQRQAITNKVRNILGLPHQNTGSEFGSYCSVEKISQVGTANELYPEYNTPENKILKNTQNQ